ncbi:MAG: ZIP family metal transporter [Chloroflexi bacterium]|nr:ZIP family metal transporter [Chloroflexota bacterium]
MIPFLYALVTSAATLTGGVLPMYTRLRLVEQRYLVGFAGGAMVAIALFDLIPQMGAHNSIALLLGFFSIYLLEKLVMIHACGEAECESHTIGWSAMIGIAAESLIDGVAISIGFRAAPALGLLIALAVFAHEVPRGLTTTVIMQEAGYSRGRVWAALAVDAGFAPLGVLLAGLVPSSAFEWLIGFTAGVFLYIGASDLLPDAHRRFNLRVVLSTLSGGGLVTLLGILLGK